MSGSSGPANWLAWPAEAASALGLSVAVLAERPDDAACAVAAEVLLGSPLVEADLRALAERAGRAHLRPRAGGPGHRARPRGRRRGHPARALDPGDGGGQGPHAGRPRRTPASPVPAHIVLEIGPMATARRRRARSHGSAQSTVGPSCSRPPGAATTARASGRSTTRPRRQPGGWPLSGTPAGRRDGPVRGRAGGHGRPPPVGGDSHLAGHRRRPRSAASVAKCSSPGGLPAGVVDQARDLGQRVAEIAGAVGVLAVELFLVERRADGQRDRRPAPQFGPLDDGGGGHLPVREPPPGRPRSAPRLDRAPARPGGQRERFRGSRR